MNTPTRSLLLFTTIALASTTTAAEWQPPRLDGALTPGMVFTSVDEPTLFWDGRRLQGQVERRLFRFPQGEVTLVRHPDPSFAPTLSWKGLPFADLGIRNEDDFVTVRWEVHPHPGVLLRSAQESFSVYPALPTRPHPQPDPSAALGQLVEGRIPYWYDLSRSRVAEVRVVPQALEIDVEASGCLNGPFPGASCHAIGVASSTFRLPGAQLTRGRVTIPFPDGRRRAVASWLPGSGPDPLVKLLSTTAIVTDGQAIAVRTPDTES